MRPTNTNIEPPPSGKRVRFQISNVTALASGPLPSIARDANVAERDAATPENSHTHVLVTGRTMEGVSVQVQVQVPPGFFIRWPLNWNQRHAKMLGKAIGAHTSEVQQRIRFVGFTPHLPNNSFRNLPQQMPYAYFTFKTTEQARRCYYTMKTKEGHRKPGPYWHRMLQRAKLDTYVLRKCAKDVFSAHDLADPASDFFNRVNSQLSLTSQETRCSYESWIELDDAVRWLPASHYFALGDWNARIKMRQLVAVDNHLAQAPFSIMSFDVEQYAGRVAGGPRRFPLVGEPEDKIVQISCSHRMGGYAPIEKTVVCLGKTEILPEAPPAPEHTNTDAYEDDTPETTPEERAAMAKGDRELRATTKLVCVDHEVELLLAFAQQIVDRQVDILTGFNIIGYDLSVIFCRAYIFWLCQNRSYSALYGVWEDAAEKMQQYKALLKRTDNWDRSASEEVQRIFNIRTTNVSSCRKPPMQHQVLAMMNRFSIETYQYFANAPSITPFFYCGKIPTQQITYEERLFETSAHGQLNLKMWKGTGMGILCAWLLLKKSTFKLASYSLKNVLKHFFPKKPELHKVDLSYEDMFQSLESKDPHRLGEVAVYCARDSEAVLFLLEEISTIVQLRQTSALVRTSVELLCSCGMQKMILNMLRSVCHPAYVLNNFHLDPFEYVGATVIAPVPAFYEWPIATLDYASLYPSIMQAINACPSTLVLEDLPKGQTVRTRLIPIDAVHSATFVQNPSESKNFGVIPNLLASLLFARRSVKKMMKNEPDAKKKSVLDARQMALKIACNSVYGFFGVKTGYFPITAIAAAVTSEGRRIIVEETKSRVEALGWRVVYGDTDSIMVELAGLDMKQAWAKAEELADYITHDVLKEFESLVLEAEKINKFWLIMPETKKRYVGLANENPHDVTQLKLDYKGIELKRRDATKLLKGFMGEIVKTMMPPVGDGRVCTTAPVLVQIIEKWIAKVVNDEVEVEHYQKSMTARTSYKGSLPGHMHVFRRHNERIRKGEQNGEIYNSGDRIPYVVTHNPRLKKVSERVMDPQWIKHRNRIATNRKEKILVDRVYYLKQCSDALCKLLIYHVPFAEDMFRQAILNIKRQYAHTSDITSFFHAATKPAPTAPTAPTAQPTQSATTAPTAPTAQPQSIFNAAVTAKYKILPKKKKRKRGGVQGPSIMSFFGKQDPKST
ncbi:hypothetical protein OAM67_00685 [bacterium]|nr:hypothetical protein [bacterium]